MTRGWRNMHCAAASSQKKKKRSPDKENSSEEILAIREQRQQRYDVAGGCREGRKQTNKGNIREVGMRAMWPARRSLHPLCAGAL